MVNHRGIRGLVLLFSVLLLVAPAPAAGAGDARALLAGDGTPVPAAAQDPPADESSTLELPPNFAIWYGTTQTFGTLGNPQKEINILGNVQKATTLSYRLNGQDPFRQIAIGGVTALAAGEALGEGLDPWGGMNDDPGPIQLPGPANPNSPELQASPRLEYEGDFNVELLVKDLQDGPNTLELKAVGAGGETAQTLTINYQRGTTWPLPYTIDWSTVTEIRDVAQIVEGEWSLAADSIRPTRHGYDRMIAIGDLSWTDFQVTVPVTIHSFPFEDSGGVGIASRWEGHFQVADEQPGNGWWNLGAYAFYLNRPAANGGERLAMFTGHYDRIDDSSGYQLARNKPYYFRLRAQTKEAGKSGFYSFKVWDPSTEDEADVPWVFEVQDAPPDELFSGSAALVAHDVDASFGDVEILPVLDVAVATVGSGSVAVTPSLSGQSDAYLYGDTIQLEAVPAAGWVFVGWSGGLTGNQNPKPVTLASDLNVTATFVQGQAYQLSVSVSGSGQVQLDPVGPWYAGGTVVKLRPVAATGWTFTGWGGTDAGALVSNGDGTWSLAMTKNRSVQATFVKKQYALSTSTSGQGTVTRVPNQATYEHGTQVQLVPGPAAGWTFTGWSGDLSGSANPATILMDAPKTVTAHFGDVDVGPLAYDGHTVDDDQLGTSDGNGDGKVQCGETIELFVDLANGGTQAATGVVTDISTGSAYVTWTGNRSSTYPDIPGSGTQTNSDDFEFAVAANAPHGHQITFNLEISSATAGLHTDAFQVPVNCLNSEGSLDRQVLERDDDAEERQYGTVYLGGSDLELVEDVDGPQTVGIRFQNITIPKGTPIAEAYLEFTADEQGSRTTNLDFYCQASDNAPSFSSEAFSLSTLPKTAASVAWNKVPAWSTVGGVHRTPNLAPIVQEIVNRSGWAPGNSLAFLIVGEGVRTAESFDGNKPDAAPRLHVTYGRDPACYTLDKAVSPAGSGSVNMAPSPNCGANRYIEGTQVTLSASASPGWFFSGWSGSLTGTTNPATISMDSAKSVTATFGQAQYQLNVGVVGTGSVTRAPDKAGYSYGEQVVLTATAPAGWSFAGWSGDLTGTTNPATVTMNRTKTVTAIFTRNEYALTVNVVGGGTVSRSPNQATYYHGDVVQLTAVASTGWSFSGWSGDLSGTANPASLTMDRAKAVTATFTGIVGPLVYASHTVDDDGSGASSGNGDGFVDCGEHVELVVSLYNQGGAAAQAVNGALSTSDPYITSLGNTASAFGEIAGQAAGTNQKKYDFQVSAGTPHLHYATFSLNVTASNGGPWPLSVQLPIACLANAGKADAAIVASSDDAEERASGGAVTTQEPVLELGQNDLGAQWVGLRYQNLVIPRGAKIGEATLQFTASQAGSGAISLVIRGQDSDNASAFSSTSALAAGLQGSGLEASNYDISSRPRTSASVAWSGLPAWTAGQAYQSPNLAPIIQEIVDRGGWNPGNALVLVMSGSGRRTAHAYDGDPAKAPRLKITFGGDLTCHTLAATASPPAGGSVVPTPAANCGASRYLDGTVVQLAAEPALDHAFAGWSGDASGTANPFTLTMNGDRRVTAAFTAETCFTLTTGVSPAASGAVVASPEPNCGGGKYVAGTSVQLTAVPQDVYQFSHWSGAAAGSDNPLTVVVDADKGVTANFATCHSLTAFGAPEGAGTVSMSPPANCGTGRYVAGTPVTLTAAPSPGYGFTGWAGGLTGTENPKTVTVSANLLVVANFAEGACTALTGRVVPTGSGNLSASPPPDCPGGKYTAGTQVQVTARPRPGFEFQRWSGAASGTSNPTTVVVGAGSSVTAEFGLQTVRSRLGLPLMTR